MAVNGERCPCSWWMTHYGNLLVKNKITAIWCSRALHWGFAMDDKRLYSWVHRYMEFGYNLAIYYKNGSCL